MTWLVVFSYFAVYGLLYPRYGRDTWRVVAPTAIASLTTLALLGSVGAGLQLFHVLALMLLLGIGIDYGIFCKSISAGAMRSPGSRWRFRQSTRCFHSACSV